LSIWGTQNPNTVETKRLVKIGPSKIVQELDFPELTVEDVKLKVHTVRTGCAAELAKVIKSKQNEPALQDV
jgi:hypothetical protein